MKEDGWYNMSNKVFEEIDQAKVDEVFSKIVQIFDEKDICPAEGLLLSENILILCLEKISRDFKNNPQEDNDKKRVDITNLLKKQTKTLSNKRNAAELPKIEGGSRGWTGANDGMLEDN
jgi:hypothetical protein